ncbi:hypothetical protein ACRQ1B_28765 [Rhizobium panacihumi]|uniref:hypothetical protein n=1 Tax=Rhizobium panacihumi TaxID=2008450 RepID=UPI003D79F3D9
MLTHKQKDEVLRQAFVAFVSFSKHSLSPTQTSWARERAENCLWALGVKEFEGFQARVPDPIGDTIDLEATRLMPTDNSES